MTPRRLKSEGWWRPSSKSDVTGLLTIHHRRHFRECRWRGVVRSLGYTRYVAQGGDWGALLHAHEIVLKEARTMARLAADRGDEGTNDLIVSEIIRSNELQVWFMAEHVVDVPLAHAL